MVTHDLGKNYFIVGIYDDMVNVREFFRPTEDLFQSIQDCKDWISTHRLYFNARVHLGIFSFDNKFDYE